MRGRHEHKQILIKPSTSIRHFDWLAGKTLRSAHLLWHDCVCFYEALHKLEKEPAYWDAQASATLGAALKLRPRDHQARNIILFLGDGRSQCHYRANSGRRMFWYQHNTMFNLIHPPYCHNLKILDALVENFLTGMNKSLLTHLRKDQVPDD